MRDLHNNLAFSIVATPKTIVNSGSPENIVSGDIDLAGFEAVMVVAMLGDIDELGSSPVGGAKVEMIIDHANDDGTGAAGTYAAVELADVIGPSSVTGGVVASSTADEAFMEFGSVAFTHVGNAGAITVAAQTDFAVGDLLSIVNPTLGSPTGGAWPISRSP